MGGQFLLMSLWDFGHVKSLLLPSLYDLIDDQSGSQDPSLLLQLSVKYSVITVDRYNDYSDNKTKVVININKHNSVGFPLV